MQLTGGQYKGRKIDTPNGVRPTLAVARESVFNVLNSYLNTFENKRMLDMYLGSGIMTLEALSRGFFVRAYEINPLIIKTAKQNCASLNVKCEIRRGDCIKSLLKCDDKYDVIYADPPWDNSYESVFKICAKNLSADGVAIVECDKKKKLNILKELESMSKLELFKEKNYGRCCLLFLKLS